MVKYNNVLSCQTEFEILTNESEKIINYCAKIQVSAQKIEEMYDR